MSEIKDIAYKFGSGRYFQGENMLEQVGPECKKVSKKVYVVGGPTAIALTKKRLVDGFESANLPYYFAEYSGYCSYASAHKAIEEMKKEGCDAIVGVGGGRIMDFAKLIAAIGILPVFTVPTSIATCAGYTTLSVLYDDTGKTVGNYYIDREVEGVFVDSDIMVHQPVRLVASGIMDALAKYIEIKNGHKEVESDSFNVDLLTASVLAKHTYDTLLENREQAFKDIENHVYSKAVETVVFLSLPVTGMISGVAKGFGQSALGHELYYQLRTHYTQEALSFLHGEVVAIGLIMQLNYNETPEQVPFLQNLMKSMDMPIKLTDIGVPNTKEAFELLGNNLIASPFVTDDEYKKQLLWESLKIIF